CCACSRGVRSRLRCLHGAHAWPWPRRRSLSLRTHPAGRTLRSALVANPASSQGNAPRLLGVAGAIIKDVAIGGLALERAGAGECPKKQLPAPESVGHPNYRRGGSNIADEAEDPLFLVQLLHGFCGPRRLVAIVRCDQR